MEPACDQRQRDAKQRDGAGPQGLGALRAGLRGAVEQADQGTTRTQQGSQRRRARQGQPAESDRHADGRCHCPIGSSSKGKEGQRDKTELRQRGCGLM